MTVITGESIRRLCQCDRPVIKNEIDINVQIQQNGIDLTLKRIERLESCGTLDFDNSERKLPEMTEVKPGIDGSNKLKYSLTPGAYVVTFNEIVAIPRYYMARACPRSSLMRCGATMSTAVWDAGFEGQSQALLIVENPYGLCLYENARIAQLVLEQLNNGVKKRLLWNISGTRHG